MKLSDAVGKRVENLLAERNMTQYQLYKNGGIPRSTISVTVDGKYKTVKLDTIYQIVATLGISLKEFFDDTLFDEIEDFLDKHKIFGHIYTLFLVIISFVIFNNNIIQIIIILL